MTEYRTDEPDDRVTLRIHRIGCSFSVGAHFMADEMAAKYLPQAALRRLQRIANDHGYTLMPETLTEVNRQPLFARETGGYDEEGQPVCTYEPLQFAPPGTEPDLWHVLFHAKAHGPW
jgi:hypothetical protein